MAFPEGLLCFRRIERGEPMARGNLLHILRLM
jgi:hypothetical protein